MPDSVLRGTVQLAGVDQALTVLRQYRQELTAIGNTRVRVTLDDADAKSKLAAFRAETGRLRAEAYAIKVVADTTPAEQDIRRLGAQARLLAVQNTQIRIVADASPAEQEIRRLTAEARLLTAQNNRIRITADTSEAESKLTQLGNRLTGAIVSGAGATIGYEVTKGLGAATSALVTYTGGLENAKIAYTNLLGSERAANQELGALQKFAANTPFDLSGVEKYSQMLLAAHVNVKDIIPDLTALGDQVAATGRGGDSLDHVVLALTQIKNSVHASAQDFNQLAQNGINAYSLVGDAIGKTDAQVRQMMESGQISGQQAFDAIISQLSQRNVGLMEQMSKTFLGRVENFEDNFRQEFARISQDTGLFDTLKKGLSEAADALASPKFKQVAGDLVGDLTTVIHVGEEAAQALGKIPTPVIEAAVHVGELAVAVKVLSTATSFTKDLIAPLIGSLTAETTAYDVQTASINANTLAKERNGNVPAGGAGAAGAGGIAGRLGGATMPIVAGIVSTLIGSASAGGRIGGDIGSGDWMQALGDFAKYNPLNPLAGVAYPLQQFFGLDLYSDVLGKVPGINKIPGIRDTGSVASGSSQVPFAGGPPPFLLGAGEQAAPRIVQGLLDQIKNGTMTVHEAQAAFQAYDATFGRFLDDADKLRQMFDQGVNPALAEYRQHVSDTVSASEKLRDEIRQAGQAQALGASSEDIARAIFGKTGAGADATQDQVQRAKQNIQDLSQAWQQAATAVNSVDVTKGITGLADAAPALDKARDSLRELGRQDGALDTLAAMADRFAELRKQEDAATLSYRGFLVTLDDTDARIKQIDQIKSGLKDVVDAAQQRIRQGTASDTDRQLVAQYPAAVQRLNQAKVQLTGNAAQDWLGIIANLPDWLRSDLSERQAVSAEGGGKQVLIDLAKGKDDASTAIDGIVNGKHQATVDVKFVADATGLPAWAVSALGLTGGAKQPAGGTPTAQSVSAPPGGGGGPLGFSPLAYSQYSQIAPSSGPLANPETYAALIRAAQEYNVDPRALLAFINGENVAPALAAVNNFGGIKGQGGPISPEGDTYAAYPSQQAFFAALARNLTTGDYAGDYASGNLQAIRQRYVAGNAAPSARQRANIDNTVAEYQRLVQQFPAGVVDQSGIGQGASITQVEHVADLAGGSASGSSQQILQKARQTIGEQQDKFGNNVYMWCLEIVQDIMAAAGFDERSAHPEFSNNADQRIRAAQQGLPGAGRVVSAAEAVPGDLVGWLGTSQYAGSPLGHIGVYSSPGKYIGTTQQGVQERTLGPDAIFIRPDGVVAGGPEPGSIVVNARTAAFDQRATASTPGSRAAAFDQRAASGGNAASNRGAIFDQRAAPKIQTADLVALFQNLDPRDLSSTVQQYQHLAPIFDRQAQQQLANTRYGGDTSALTDSDKAEATAAATQKTVDATIAWGRAAQDIRENSSHTAEDIQKVADTVGGPLGQNLAQALSIMDTMQQRTAEINRLTERKAQLEDEHNRVVAEQAQRDLTKRGQDLMRSIAEQEADYYRQQGRITEGARDRTETRRIQDAGDTTDRAHQLAARGFDQQIRALEKLQRTNASGNTAAEESFAAQAAGPGSLAGKRLAAEQLATQKEYDNRVRDTFTTQLDGIKEAQVAENDRYEDAKYNIQEESKAETRRHENADEGFDEEDRRIARQRQLRSESDQIAAYNLEVIRFNEDKRYQAAIDGIDRTIAADQKLNDADNARLQAVQALANAYDSVDGSLANILSTVVGNVSTLQTSLANGLAQYQAAIAGLKTANGVPFSQFPLPGSGIVTKAYGGAVPPGSSAIVGDDEFGRLTPYSEMVRNVGNLVTVTPLGNRPSSGGGLSIGNLIGSLSIAPTDSEATFKRRVLAAMDGPLSDIWRELQSATRAATGAGRRVG